MTARVAVVVPVHATDEANLLDVRRCLESVLRHASATIECVGFFPHQEFLRESHRVLSDGGLLIFDSVNRYSYRWFLRQLTGRSAARAMKRLLDRAGDVKHLRKTKSSAGTYQLSCREVIRMTTRNGFDVQTISGYNWVPLDVRSNSAWIGPAALLEHGLCLDRFYSASPWFLVAARKRVTDRGLS